MRIHSLRCHSFYYFHSFRSHVFCPFKFSGTIVTQSRNECDRKLAIDINPLLSNFRKSDSSSFNAEMRLKWIKQYNGSHFQQKCSLDQISHYSEAIHGSCHKSEVSTQTKEKPITFLLPSNVFILFGSCRVLFL